MIAPESNVFQYGKVVVQLSIYERKIPGSISGFHTVIVELIVDPFTVNS